MLHEYFSQLHGLLQCISYNILVLLHKSKPSFFFFFFLEKGGMEMFCFDMYLHKVHASKSMKGKFFSIFMFLNFDIFIY